MPRVLVALSGGVDSSAAAVLLQKQGYQCDGATLHLYSPASTNGFSPVLDTSDAEVVANTLQINFSVWNEESLFSSCVMDHFVDEYCKGHTPNPCIDCNKHLKFGRFLEKALDLGYDYIATGHYGKIEKASQTGRYLLYRGADHSKDQSYVLYHLNQHQLSHLLLPLGQYSKEDIRTIAQEAGLVNANRPDSQDICFIPNGDYGSFLQTYGKVNLKPGNFVLKDGTIVGQHKGLPCYTLGQRKGLGIAYKHPLFVLEKRDADNTIVLGEEDGLFSTIVYGKDTNIIPFDSWEGGLPITAKTRYSQKEAEAFLYLEENNRVRCEFTTPQRAVTPGQAIVFYQGDLVVGGATII